ncbi:hypothetical protein PHLGIDRAFT_424357 [Phlebiopsis gigantea 11061_1 CR5-6]|uniref:Uncharacterized protein n=1 Tax=Phlebiopsis gigantea (strain 11061_1 CR5-6) TaxID=745531 RepID=A0A0C3S8F0_PHLG1|nr:hypothetical protein PHLGIDRAFT_424357 [Phlebiopsis gigantea 11061_1 CR5-6]
MKKFARSQVEHLARRLEYEKSLSVEIVRTRAMNEYSLTPDQMDTLIPMRTAPNPYKPGTEMRFYNVKDVEACIRSLAMSDMLSRVSRPYRNLWRKFETLTRLRQRVLRPSKHPKRRRPPHFAAWQVLALHWQSPAARRLPSLATSLLKTKMMSTGTVASSTVFCHRLICWSNR